MGFRGRKPTVQVSLNLPLQEGAVQKCLSTEIKVPIPAELVTASKEEMVAKINRGDVLFDREKKREEKAVAYLAGQIYYQKLEKYYQIKYPINWRARLEKTNGALGCCSRIVAQATILGVSLEDYIEAQFWAFDKFFRRHPAWKDMASGGALQRVQQWLFAKGKGEVPNATVNIGVVSVYSSRGVLSHEVMKHEERVLRSMVEQWGSEQRVWLMFGEIGNEDVFSDAFKRTREEWRALYGQA